MFRKKSFSTLASASKTQITADLDIFNASFKAAAFPGTASVGLSKIINFSGYFTATEFIKSRVESLLRSLMA